MDFARIRKSSDYRTFLKAYLDEHSLSLSDLARTAGFGRGFPSDVISGRRRLTLKSARAFEKALKLPSAGKRLFRLLVAQAEPDLHPDVEPQTLTSKISELRKKPWNRPMRELPMRQVPKSGHALSNTRSVTVFAAAGDPEQGASFDEIATRTRLTKRDLLVALEELKNAGLLTHRDERYFPTDLHLFLKTTDSKDPFIALFREASTIAADRVSESIGSLDEFFFTSSFCIDESRMPEFKATLRKTLLTFVNDSIKADGDQVARIVVAFQRS